MRAARWSRLPALGLAVLLTATACTEDPEPPARTPQPSPTGYSGEAPPGLGAEPLRTLTGEGAPAILDDPLGVRIQAVGEAFLISAQSKQHHVLRRASDGAKLWEGDQNVDRFTRDREHEPVFTITSEADGTTTTAVITSSGEQAWRSSDPREVYVNGWVVRRPEGWSAEQPYGEYTVTDTGGSEAWTFAFGEEQVQPADESAAEEEEPAAEEEEPEPTGVPVGASGDVLFLRDGAGLIQARDLAQDGELLWQIGDEDDYGFATDDGFPRPEPQIVGAYSVPAAEGPDRGGGSASPSASAEESGAEESGARETVLLRWSYPEDPSVLALQDTATGETLWATTEPGANPSAPGFTLSPVTGPLYDEQTHTLLVPQATGETPMIAVDITTGDIRWRFESDQERAIAASFALNSYIYGNTRTADKSDGGSVQVVLDAETKEVVGQDLAGYVEAATPLGHAIVIQNGRRFVFPPAGPPEKPSSTSPSSSPSG